ncbi:helix-turn-helix domain-containing protein [Geomonas nitrogeniifigens]|uniref:Helix-turn-helix domain-containing protein n=1 Tax=Geomonas diazotrophica TaxID=2843197 RepID=A0ABX8JPV9_9BACT|nr:helix-turn-helix domain-containing protein [Geomonas nitrogeniifigens]QWV97455.1 helix-turn-helix domain-containing protein [Geomonas nitrogeniifigens]
MAALTTLLTTQEAAEILRVKESTLEQWRWQGRGPQFVKLGRLVRYRLADLEAYLAERVSASTTVTSHMLKCDSVG